MSFGSLTSVLARPLDVWSWGNFGSSALPSFDFFFLCIAFSNKGADRTCKCPTCSPFRGAKRPYP